MIQNPYDVLRNYPVRKTLKQKSMFADAVIAYAISLGYECKVEKGSFGSRNIVIGNPEKAKHLITAHYDTCAALPFPNLITPCNILALILYSILTTVLLFIPAVIVAAIVLFLSQHFMFAYYVCYGVLVVELVLVLIGPANRHNSNDNTSGIVTLLEIAASVPQIHRDKLCFVLFDLEEAGTLGSAAYAKAHKSAIKDQLVWNLDCVGDGDCLLLFPNAKVRKKEYYMRYLRKCSGTFGDKTVSTREKGFSFYPSDQMNFPFGVGIAALHKGPFGYYLGRIHTGRDTILETTNVNILRAAIVSAIVCDAD